MKGGNGRGAGGNLDRVFPYDDLRGWIAEAERLGELRRVEGANWQEEIGMAAEVVSHDDHAPAVLFGDVPGCLKGSRVLVNLFGGKRKNMTLGFPAELDKVALSEAFADAFYGNREADRAQPGPGRAGVREHHAGRRDRPRRLPDAALAREGWRPLYRHRLLSRHPRPRDRLDQSRLLPRHDQGQAHGQPQRAAGPACRPALQEVLRARRDACRWRSSSAATR